MIFRCDPDISVGGDGRTSLVPFFFPFLPLLFRFASSPLGRTALLTDDVSPFSFSRCGVVRCWLSFSGSFNAYFDVSLLLPLFSPVGFLTGAFPLIASLLRDTSSLLSTFC